MTRLRRTGHSRRCRGVPLRRAARRRGGVRRSRRRRSRGAEGRNSAARRRSRFPPPIPIRRKSARSASGCSTTSGSRPTAASPARPATTAPRDFPTAASRRSACRGARSRAIRRRLWNLAWAGPVFWDGRARSLEEQVAGPIIAPDEMAQPIDKLVARLAADRDYARAFAKAFPDDPRVSEENLRKAIATYERTLVSPRDPLRSLDRGRDGSAVGAGDGRLPAVRRQGRLRQLPCGLGLHGLRVLRHRTAERRSRPRRGAAAASRPNTPSRRRRLREVGRRAPYMHDGSLADARRRRAPLCGRHRRAADAVAATCARGEARPRPSRRRSSPFSAR